MNIRTYQPGDEEHQKSIYNQAAGALPKFKPATLGEVIRRVKAKEFDPGTRFYAEENDRVVGYCVFNTNGRVSYPWVLRDHEHLAEPLFRAVIEAMQARKMPLALAAYRGDWPVVAEFFKAQGFRLAREMVNFVVDTIDMPTAAARRTLPFTPLRREDVPAIFTMGTEALRVKTPAELEKHLFENPHFGPETLFVLRDRTNDTPRAVGILVTGPDYADGKQVDAAMPCFRCGAFGTEGMQTKRIRGLFSFLAPAGKDFNSLGIELLGQAAMVYDDETAPWLAAQAPSDVPHLVRFYQQLFRKQGSFPVFERAL